jgi:hypothetical protein
MDTFSTIRFKIKVANRFRKFSIQIARTHTEAIESMLDFFENNSISPYESLGVNMTTLESKIKKRINSLIAIIKDIEKHQTKPTNSMMQLLFQENPEEKFDPLFMEKNEFESENLITENEELEYYRNQYFNTQTNYNDLKYDFEIILKKTRYVKNNFGTGHYRMNITKGEFEKLKQKLENVYHNNTTETK